jgi:hypothetical protein
MQHANLQQQQQQQHQQQQQQQCKMYTRAAELCNVSRVKMGGVVEFVFV